MTGAAALTLGSAGGLIVPDLSRRGLLSPDGVIDAASIAFADAIYTEAFPTSPLIMSPFTDKLPIPKAMAPTPKSEYGGWKTPPGPAAGQLTSMSSTEKHQLWCSQISYPDPIVYKIKLQINEHKFTTSKVLPINSSGQKVTPPAGSGVTLDSGGLADLPASTIYGFNGTFPGPRINAEYGKPVLVRFINELDQNPKNLDVQDFGAPDRSFLTHLHNGHTACESDGNPHYTMRKLGYHGYPASGDSNNPTWCDNLYLNYPAGGDDNEKQSFFWFHDHRMDHTGSNVYKGMVGLYPIYDPKNGKDMGDERQGLRLPGVRTNNQDGSFDVEYDIPLAFYDCRLDDGVTTHQDIHDGLGEFPNAKNPKMHPEWWGKTFFKHFPNHGFVGDIFTVNGTAYPVLEVKRRKYRLRFLDASIARQYEFKLMSSRLGPKAAKDLGYSGTELQGQYRLTDGQQCMKFTQIASDGGLLPFPIVRDSFELWPAKRREFVVDFTRYMDGSPTTKGDVIYLTNIMKMPDGRLATNSTRVGLDPKYVIPVMKIVIGDDAPDDSVMPTPSTKLRDLPKLPGDWKSLMNNRLIFEVQRGSAGGEVEWLINGVPFDPTTPVRSMKNPAGNMPLARQKLGSWNVWEIRNGGGGWTHPFHLHMEEHVVKLRNGKAAPDAGHPEDNSREDLINLDPSESVIIARQFRTFTGQYVAHCHNLAHEDHAMMFGWEIVP
jgi:FtsP/CotA-like multicopper oxidase with cupredoxin domain